MNKKRHMKVLNLIVFALLLLLAAYVLHEKYKKQPVFLTPPGQPSGYSEDNSIPNHN
mgnify:CR=1 FL=1